MFQSLRQNGQIYVFHKGNTPSLEIGTITNIPAPRPKYSVPVSFGQTQEMVVDVVAKIKDRLVNFSALPANADISDSFSNGESVVVSDNRDAMNAEILSFKQKSVDAINSVDVHKAIVSSCDGILDSLNPEYAEKKQQQDEISTLKSQMSDVSKHLASLTEMIETLTRKEQENEQTVGNTRKR